MYNMKIRIIYEKFQYIMKGSGCDNGNYFPKKKETNNIVICPYCGTENPNIYPLESLPPQRTCDKCGNNFYEGGVKKI